ncbi:hypothetical protein OG535_16650 [Kitasatospora sp. NBC_00085]|uniref:hypothetical protein n=1 Tax=unclassified Kitasatospora TaxID=2633591 RepID=UPI00324B5A22
MPLVQWHPPDVEDEVDPGVVVSPEPAVQLLAAVALRGRPGPRLRAFFECSSYGAIWTRARAADLATPLGMRPYDLRHARVSLRLKSGVDATGVARRSGHSAAVLLRVYAKCIHGAEDHANELISQRLQRRAPTSTGA